ncbi:MAG: hypothetical protein ABI411_12825 [Tahibacter sp.]
MRDLQPDRRDFLTTLGAAMGVALIPGAAFGAAGGICAASTGAAGKTHAEDWRWLAGNWDVFHRRLRERLAGSNDWEEFNGKSAFWQTLGGLGNVDDNILDISTGSYRGLTVRAYDAKSGNWAIWWLDGRNPTHLEPPVLGSMSGDEGEFTGRDTFKDRPIVMRFRWHEVHGKRPWWDQAFSTDDGKNWEINWRNYFTRTSATATPHPLLANAPHDFDFLVGSWKVQHRRLRERLVGSKDWDEFGGSLVNWPVLGGFGNVGDNVMERPSGTIRGVGFRSYDVSAQQWLVWWLDARNPHAIDEPLRGSFADGVGTFLGDELVDGRRVKTRARWSTISPTVAQWEQASSVDDGATWEINWVSELTRQA